MLINGGIRVQSEYTTQSCSSVGTNKCCSDTVALKESHSYRDLENQLLRRLGHRISACNILININLGFN